MKKQFLSITLLAIFFSLHADFNEDAIPEAHMQKFSSTNTYEDQEITPSSLLGLLPQPPAKLKNFVRAWLERHEDVAKLMSADEAFNGPDPVITRDNEGKAAYLKKMHDSLSHAGLKNLSVSSNMIVEVDKDLILKAGGIGNRYCNIDAELGKGYGEKISPEELEEFNTQHGGKTFQTISRASAYLRGLEAKKLFNLEDITFPETHLIHIPGRPEEVCDANYVVLEEKIKDPVAFLQDHRLALDESMMKQLMYLIGYTGLWNHIGSSGNIFVVKDPETEKLKACYFDLEQPNFHRKPTNFLNKDTEKYLANIRHGWAGVEGEIIQHYTKQVRTSIDKAEMPDDHKQLLHHLLNARVASLLEAKKKVEEKISARFPQA